MSRHLSLGRSRRRRLIGAAVTTMLALGLLVAIPVAKSTTAQAAPVTGFNPGNIISDAVMYNSRSMSAAQIQTFLNQRGSNCTPTSGNTCVKDYTERTPTRAATSLCTGTYQGAASESAASIIAKVSVACGVNPQVLLVTLQKEQGLITASTGKSAATYSRALGFGCPDNAGGWCDPQYAGFGNQVYSAAQQLKRYAANPNGYAHRAGVVNQVRYHPTASCGSSAVYIENQATASLYNYTPYQPNAAALAAGTGTGDSCSSYGNRNFHIFFTEWFGSAAQQAPKGSLDVVSPISPGVVQVRGWAFDPDTSASINVHIYANGRAVRAVTANGSRPDVARIHNVGDSHGYDTTVNLPPGTHEVCVYAIDSSGGSNPRIGCRTVTVTNQAPRGSVDIVRTAGPGVVQVRGWAFDPDTSASINVHIYANGRAVRAVTANGSRPDVARIHNVGDSHGYDTTVNLPPGSHEVCVYAIDSSGGSNPRIGCRPVEVANTPPTGGLEGAAPLEGSVSAGIVSRGGALLTGWARDPDSTEPIRVRALVDNVPVANSLADIARSDLPGLDGAGRAGFSFSADALPGGRRVCVQAEDSSDGSWTEIGCSSVTVPNAPPRAALDVVQGQVGSVKVRGWAIDPDVLVSVMVHVYADGRLIGAVRADGSRPDVARIYNTDPARGFDASFVVDPGARNICLYSINQPAGSNPLIRCETVAVS